MNSVKKTILFLVMAAVIISFLFQYPIVAAEDPMVPEQTVRVGYYENEVFEEGAAPDAVKTGYAYEYYRKISEYTGWNYEYVYGSFDELYDMLINGEIDLLAGLALRDDRTAVIGYPTAPMGNENYTLVKYDDDASVTYSVSSISGKKIGVLKSAIADVLKAFLKEQSIEADIVMYKDYESLFDAFDQREVDILAAEGDGAYGRSHAQVIGVFGSSDYYLCVNVQRQDLLKALDTAQSQLAVEEPDYISTLKSKYYSSSVSSHTYGTAEREWIDTHKSLKVGYFNNYLPYSATGRDGEVTGIVSEIIPAILSELSVSDIEVSYSGYDNYDDMIAGVETGEIDVCFPVGGGLYYSEASGIYQSATVASVSTDLVYSGEYSGSNVSHFAVNSNNRMQYYYIRTNFPDAGISFYPDIDSCLMAVLGGEADATTLNGLRANEILKNGRYKGLYLQQLSQTDDRAFGVKIGNEGLLKLFNHGIKILGTEYSQDIAYRYTSELYSYTVADMIKDNILLFLVILLMIAVLIIAFVIRDLKRTRLANSLKSDFVSNMSHEIRTPITAILGMNDLIQRECDDESILQYSDNIGKAGESLLGIINDILDFSKIESGHMELAIHPYSLPELLSDITMMIKLRADERNLSFAMDVDEKLPVMPIGDMQKLRQVIMNLLTNAVKYTEKGSVKFSARLLSLENDEFTMEIAVEDTGIGIKEEEIDKLYSAFDRLDIERNRNIEGSGLGLAITQRMLSLMGSEIEVNSVYGKGSRFFFKIKQGISDASPIGRYEAAAAGGKIARKRKTASFKANDARILVVDDTPMNLNVITGLLKGNELMIDTAQSGDECIALFAQNRYDMVFLDQRMPNMDGVQTLHEMKRLYPDARDNTPVICLTANALSGAKEQMLKEGFDDYLTKPVKLEDIEQIMIKYIPEEKIHMVTGSQADTCDSTSNMTDVITSTNDSVLTLLELRCGLDCAHGIEYCGDEEDYIDALDIYRASVENKAKQLEAAFSRGDNDELSMLLHSLKSTSGAIGAESLRAQAQELEAAAREGREDELKEDVPKFIADYIALGDKLNEIMRQEGTGCKETE